MSLLKLVLVAAGLASTVAAHGYVKKVNYNGQEYVQSFPYSQKVTPCEVLLRSCRASPVPNQRTSPFYFPLMFEEQFF